MDFYRVAMFSDIPKLTKKAIHYGRTVLFIEKFRIKKLECVK